MNILKYRIRNASIGWYFRQLVPQAYWAVYDDKRVVLWKMWLGRCYDVVYLQGV